MSRVMLILRDAPSKETALRWVAQAPPGTRVEFKAPKRTLPQNDRFWAMLTDVARQKEHNGRKYPPEVWKALFMNAAGREIQFLPTLDGKSVFPLSYSSSDLGVGEMTELMEFMSAWGAENGVVFNDTAP